MRDWLVMLMVTAKLGAILILAAIVLTLTLLWRHK